MLQEVVRRDVLFICLCVCVCGGVLSDCLERGDLCEAVSAPAALTNNSRAAPFPNWMGNKSANPLPTPSAGLTVLSAMKRPPRESTSWQRRQRWCWPARSARKSFARTSGWCWRHLQFFTFSSQLWCSLIWLGCLVRIFCTGRSRRLTSTARGSFSIQAARVRNDESSPHCKCRCDNHYVIPAKTPQMGIGLQGDEDMIKVGWGEG